MTDRPSVTDDARAEAARRWGDRRTSDRLPVDWLDEGMASGFVLGAQWAAARAETTAETTTERIARQIAATSAMTGRDALDLVGAVQALQNAETTTDLHWSNAAAAEYPGDEYEQYPLRTAFGRGVKWERKRAARKGAEQ